MTETADPADARRKMRCAPSMNSAARAGSPQRFNHLRSNPNGNRRTGPAVPNEPNPPGRKQKRAGKVPTEFDEMSTTSRGRRRDIPRRVLFPSSFHG